MLWDTDIFEQGETKELLINPKSTEAKSLVISVPPTNKKIDRFKLISPDGKEIASNSTNLTKNIIKTWGVRENKNQNRKSEICTAPLERYTPQGRPPGEKVSKVSISSRRDAPKV